MGCSGSSAVCLPCLRRADPARPACPPSCPPLRRPARPPLAVHGGQVRRRDLPLRDRRHVQDGAGLPAGLRVQRPGARWACWGLPGLPGLPGLLGMLGWACCCARLPRRPSPSVHLRSPGLPAHPRPHSPTFPCLRSHRSAPIAASPRTSRRSWSSFRSASSRSTTASAYPQTSPWWGRLGLLLCLPSACMSRPAGCRKLCVHGMCCHAQIPTSLRRRAGARPSAHGQLQRPAPDA